ncbi:MAG: Dabb family protein [Thermoleophilaceae bacterium]
MIQHIVLVKWKPGTTEEEILEAFGDARRLLEQIPSVKTVTLGRNRAESDHGFTHALIVNLANEEALRSYLEHPVRVRYVNERMQPLEEQRIEIDVPVDVALHREPRIDWEWSASVGMALPPED